MRVPNSHQRSSGRPDAAMTPLIDVVFLLLIFFVWTSSFQAVEKLLTSDVTVPSGRGGVADLREEDFERILVRLEHSSTGIQWRINGQTVDTRDELSRRLMALAEIRADLPVVVHPDGEVPLGDVILVYDVARDVGLANIQFTTAAKR